MTDQVNACERAADPSCTESFTRRLAVAAYQADAAMEGAWFAHNYVETSGCEAEFISWCSPKAILRLLREHELFRQALLAHPDELGADEVRDLWMATDADGITTTEHLRRFAKRIQAAALPAVPEGWALVPKVPTEAMTHAMAAALDFPSVYMGGPSTGSKRKAATVYAAMLAATPAHDKPEGSDNE